MEVVRRREVGAVVLLVAVLEEQRSDMGWPVCVSFGHSCQKNEGRTLAEDLKR